MTHIHGVTQGSRCLYSRSYTTDKGEKVWGRHPVSSCISAIHHFHSYPIGHSSCMVNPAAKKAGKCREPVDIDDHDRHCHNYYHPHVTIKEIEVQKNGDITPVLAASVCRRQTQSRVYLAVQTSLLIIACSHLHIPCVQTFSHHRGRRPGTLLTGRMGHFLWTIPQGIIHIEVIGSWLVPFTTRLRPLPVTVCS